MSVLKDDKELNFIFGWSVGSFFQSVNTSTKILSDNRAGSSRRKWKKKIGICRSELHKISKQCISTRPAQCAAVITVISIGVKWKYQRTSWMQYFKCCA